MIRVTGICSASGGSRGPAP